MNTEQVMEQLKNKFKEPAEWSTEWGNRIEQFVPDYEKLKPDDVASLAEGKLWKLWCGSWFAETGTPGLPKPNTKQWQDLRNMTALLADRTKSLGERYCATAEACERAFTAQKTQPPVILRTLLILEGGLYGTVATRRYTNLLLKWAGKPELNYREPASITMALDNVRALVEEWAPKIGVTKLGERARIPWHLCEIIETEAAAEGSGSPSLEIRETSEGSDATVGTGELNSITIEHYDKKKAMDGLFLAETQFDEMLEALKEKKNVVLQGAPGVGKTFVAKRLAYALIESNDQRQVEMIQFHQSYSYEDFIQGFRPTPNGHFDLKHGIFYQFCRRAQRDEAAKKPYVFIIDEINRGNLSKIFGELMMLIEPDKRGKEHAIQLAYSQNAGERFYIPENLYLIGMMNTADRSLAMVDYALRRRFRFITLRPEFSSAKFGKFLVAAGAAPELTKKIVNRMNALNEVISADAKNLGPGYQIGHSYFCPRNGIKPNEDWYRRVIDSEIVPLIQEYWFDNEQKVKEQRSALLA
jgi:hypothetical protein